MADPKANPESTPNKWSDRIVKYSWLVSLISYFGGIVAFIFLSNHCEKTYISDNALTPGFVNREFASEPDAYIKQLREATGKNSRIPHSWLIDSFTKFGLEVYQQNFSVRFPFGKVESGTNVYAIIRAPRAQPLESLVLAAPFRSEESPLGPNYSGVALLLSLAKYFSTKNYWAKDIILLVTESEWVGMQAWLNAFHGISSNQVIQSGYLDGLSGSIQAAVILDINATRMSRMDLKIEGLNGQLPNLDLFNTAVELATHESITPTFHGKSHSYADDAWPDYVETVGKMMVSQGSSFPTGAHGLFLKFAIQSLTISVESTDSPYSHFKLLHIGRVVEGVFRSLNNLLEKFNRSYWFYLLPSTRLYISIAFYMTTFAFMALPLPIVSLKNYIILHSRQSHFMSSSESLESGFAGCFICHFLGLFGLFIPHLIEPHVKQLSQFIPSSFTTNVTDDAGQVVLFASLVTFCVLCCVTLTISKSFGSPPASMIIALLNMALLLVSVSLINISLAKFLTLVYVPICCFVQCSTKSKMASLIKKLLLLTVHPLTLNFLCLLTLHIIERPQLALQDHLPLTLKNQQEVLFKFVQHWYLFGNWTYFFASAMLLPSWLQFWWLTNN